MWLILKTFELSKNPLVHLFYLILIINTVSNERVEEPTYPIMDNGYEAEDTDPTKSNGEKSTVNDGTGLINNVHNGLLERLNYLKNIRPTKDDEKLNNMEITENGISSADIKTEDPDVEEDPFKDTEIGLSSEDIKIEDRDVEEDPFKDTEIGLSSDLETPGDVDTKDKINSKQNKKKNKKTKKNKKKNKQTSEIVDEQVVNDDDSETGVKSNTIVGTSDTVKSKIAKISDPEGNPTENIQGMPQNQNPDIGETPDNDRQTTIKNIIKNMNSRYNTPKTSENELNNNEPDEKKIGVDEDPIKDMEPNLTPDLKTPEDVELEEQTNSKEKRTSGMVDEPVVNDNDLETGANTIVGTDDTIESTIIQISDPEKDPIENTQDDMPQKLEEIDPENLEVSSLEKVEITKIKGNPSNESEVLRKKKKKAKFQEFAPQKGEARIYCTFLGNVLKMYNKVKNRFVGHFCHAIVIGTPIIIQQQRVHLTQKMKGRLNDLKLQQKESLVVVIMEYRSYGHWRQALIKKDMKGLISEIIHMVVHYNIDGIQFSNLHPIEEGAEINTQMMDRLILFLKDLQTAAITKKHELKIGINIDFNGLSIVKSFTSFKNLNTLVTWYSFKSISMVTCSPKYKDTGTSPNTNFNSIITTLIENINDNNEFDMSKLVVGIQLFPNKVNEKHPYTYEEFCSVEKSTWHKSWCAASPQDLRSKGALLRSSQIGGFQLYYMHSDDYRSTCGCHSFPLIRSFLRGLIKSSTKETCDFKTAHN